MKPMITFPAIFLLTICHLNFAPAMNITKIHSYLVHAGKGEEKQKPISGTEVSDTEDMTTMLREIFLKAPEECKHDIMFTHAPDGSQQNDCRDLILKYIDKPTIANGRLLAKRLQEVSTHRSALGLMFLILGNFKQKRLVVSRFPADNGFLAEEGGTTLDVKFVERIFMKSGRSYKSVVYEGSSPINDFWAGRAVDRQVNNDIDISEYWIKDFLLSDFSTTAERGTRTLASALRDAINDRAVPINVKEEISSAIHLCRNLDKKLVSPAEFGKKMNLSQTAQDAILSNIRPELHNERFRLSTEELDRLITFKTVELDTGAYMSALANKFDDVFSKIQAKSGNTTFSTTGKVVDERIRKRK
jgi:hypothetical protein